MHLDYESYFDQRKFDLSGYHAFNNPQRHRILLLNYEAVTPLLKKLRRLHWDRIVYDEAQRLKNRASRSARDAALLSGSGARRLALTGTPIDANPRDLWSIMKFVDSTVLGDKWTDFEDYFIEKPSIDLDKPMGAIQRKKMQLAYQIAKRKAPLREDRAQELADLVSPHVGRITKEEAGIERARVHKAKFKLDSYEDKVYRKLEKSMLVKVNGEMIKTPLKITQIGKLQQITGGHIKDEEGEVHEVGTSKRRMLRKLIKANVKNEPFVIFCKYVWEVHRIASMMERMGFKNVAKLWGKIKDTKTKKRRTDMLLGFQEGQFDVMVCQQRTGGVGVDLYHARKFFVYSMGHSFIDYDQMLSRGDFMFQNEAADFFFLMADLTIDTDISFSVEAKKSITEAFYDRLSNRRPADKHRRPTMAKKNKEEKAEKAETTAEHKYGVQDIADKLGIKPASVRVQLRNKDIEKDGKSYGWDTKKELNEVIDQLSAGKDDEDEDDKPSKKSKKSKDKKADKKKSKKSKKDDDDE